MSMTTRGRAVAGARAMPSPEGHALPGSRVAPALRVACALARHSSKALTTRTSSSTVGAAAPMAARRAARPASWRARPGEPGGDGDVLVRRGSNGRRQSRPAQQPHGEPLTQAGTLERDDRQATVQGRPSSRVTGEGRGNRDRRRSGRAESEPPATAGMLRRCRAGSSPRPRNVTSRRAKTRSVPGTDRIAQDDEDARATGGGNAGVVVVVGRIELDPPLRDHEARSRHRPQAAFEIVREHRQPAAGRMQQPVPGRRISCSR